MAKVVERYPKSPHPARDIDTTPDFLEWADANLPHVIDEVNGESSPGVPFMDFAKDNDKVVENFRLELVEIVRERIRKLCNASPADVARLDAVELVREGLVDPIRVFIKNEPHSLSKIAENLERIISSVSIADQIIDRLLNTWQNKNEIASWPDTPSMPGMGLDDEKAEILTLKFHEWLKDKPLVCSDLSRYDWTIQGWELEMDTKLRMSLGSVRPNTPLANLFYNRYLCMSLAVFAVSNGDLIAQTVRCIMKSGTFITSSTNSRIRDHGALYTGSDKNACMGDDCVEQATQDKASKYNEIGKILKNAFLVEDSDDFEIDFCSHRFVCRDGKYVGVVPSNPSKTLFRLLSQQNLDISLVVQCAYFMRHVPHFGGLLPMIEVLNSKGCFEGMPIEHQLDELPEALENVLSSHRSWRTHPQN